MGSRGDTTKLVKLASLKIESGVGGRGGGGGGRILGGGGGGRWRGGVQRKGLISSFMQRGGRGDGDDEMEEEEAPTHLNTSTCGHFLVITTDKLCAKYTGEGLHGNDVGVIQGNQAAPCHRLLYYFEITVKDRGLKGYIGIGFTDEHFRNSRQPGWEPNSYGYHGDDGKLYHGQGKGHVFGPTFTTGDTVGAGINYASQEIFFTKNGKMVGATFKDVKTALYPTIGLHSPNEKVEVNFGQRQFVYDVEALVQEERERRHRAVENVHLPPSASHSIVRAYLLHYGYHDTLAAFDAASGGSFPPVVCTPHEDGNNGTLDDDTFALDQRKVLRRLARDGDVDSVFAKLREWYPQQLQQEHDSNIIFLLHCQKFIELVKSGMLEGAVTYARTELAHFFGASLDQDLHLQDCLALLAYERPQESPMAYLLHFGQREVVADAVNAFVLATNPSLPASGKSPQSGLEKLLRQLTACHVEKRLLNGGQGEVFSLHRILQGGKDGGW